MRTEFVKIRPLSASSIAAVLLAQIPTSYAAFLDGKTMGVQLGHRTDLQSTPIFVNASFVVGPGVELTGFGFNEQPPLPPLVDIDVSDRQMLITAVMDQPFALAEELRFFPQFGTHVTNLFVNPATNWAGFTQGRVFPSSESFTIVISELTASAGQQILLDVIPEPASAGLALIACLATAAIRRRAR